MGRIMSVEDFTAQTAVNLTKQDLSGNLSHVSHVVICKLKTVTNDENICPSEYYFLW